MKKWLLLSITLTFRWCNGSILYDYCMIFAALIRHVNVMDKLLFSVLDITQRCSTADRTICLTAELTWIITELNKSIVISRLCPRCRILINTNQNIVVVWRATGTATWRTSYKHNIRRTWFWPIGPWYKSWHNPQNRKYITYRNAVIGGLSDGHRQHARIIWWNLAVWFGIMWADRQTDRQTDLLIAILGTPPPGGGGQQQSASCACN